MTFFQPINMDSVTMSWKDFGRIPLSQASMNRSAFCGASNLHRTLVLQSVNDMDPMNTLSASYQVFTSTR